MVKRSVLVSVGIGILLLTALPFVLIGGGKGISTKKAHAILKHLERHSGTHPRRGHDGVEAVDVDSAGGDGGSGEGADGSAELHPQQHKKHARHGKRKTGSKKARKKAADEESDDEAGEAQHRSGGGGRRAAEVSEGDDSVHRAPKGKRFAHVAVVGNEKYVDGALVMGWSLNKYKQRDMEMICLVTEGKVADESMARLRRVGWDKVLAVRSFAKQLSKSLWKDSFVKLHIFNFTGYEKVAYWDADMVVAQDPNSVFDMQIPEGPHHVIAIGTPPSKSHPKAYFQTGMMVFRPGMALYRDMWELFVKHLHSKYNSLNARDGEIMREFFGSHYSSLPHKYSQNIDPRKKIKKVVGVHYRGGYKPWFDRTKPMKSRLPGVDKKKDDTRKDFGYAYLLWWRLNEETQRFLAAEDGGDGWDTRDAFESANVVPYPMQGVGAATVGDVSPKTHVWMLRNTPDQYLQPYSDESARARNVSFAGVDIHVSKAGESCTDACSAVGKTCHEPSLNATWLNTCAVLRGLAASADTPAPECSTCEPGIYSKSHRGTVNPAIVQLESRVQCTHHLLLDERSTPSCGGTEDGAFRVCPCAQKGAALRREKWDGAVPLVASGEVSGHKADEGSTSDADSQHAGESSDSA